MTVPKRGSKTLVQHMKFCQIRRKGGSMINAVKNVSMNKEVVVIPLILLVVSLEVAVEIKKGLALTCKSKLLYLLKTFTMEKKWKSNTLVKQFAPIAEALELKTLMTYKNAQIVVERATGWR